MKVFECNRMLTVVTSLACWQIGGGELGGGERECREPKLGSMFEQRAQKAEGYKMNDEIIHEIGNGV